MNMDMIITRRWRIERISRWSDGGEIVRCCLFVFFDFLLLLLKPVTDQLEQFKNLDFGAKMKLKLGSFYLNNFLSLSITTIKQLALFILVVSFYKHRIE